MIRRVLLAIAILVGLELGYVLLGTAALRFLVPPLVERKGRAEIAARSAWTVVPGLVHARGVTVAIRNESIHVAVGFERVRFRIGLLALLGRELRIHAIRGDGFSFRLRSTTREEAAALAPPVPVPDEPMAPKNRERRWTYVVADGLVDRVREIWLEEYRYTGTGRLAWPLFEQAPGHLVLQPARLHDLDGRVTLGDRTLVAERLRGTLAAGFERFDPRRVRGSGVLGFLRADARIDADVQDLGFLNFYLQRSPWVQVENGAGPLSLTVRIEDGRFAPGSRLSAETAAVTGHVLGWTARGPGRLEWAVEADPAGPQGRFRLGFPTFEIGRAGGAPDVRGRDLAFSGHARDLRVNVPFPDLALRFDMPEAELPDLTAANEILEMPPGVRFRSGRGVMEAHVEMPRDGGEAHGTAVLRGRELALQVHRLLLRGAFDLRLALAGGSLQRRTFSYAGSTLAFRDVSLIRQDTATGRVAGWWADATVARGEIHVAPPLRATAQVDLRMRDSAPLLALFTPKRGLPGWLQVVLRVDAVRARAGLALGRGHLVLDPLVVRGEPLRLDARLRFGKGPADGVLLARVGRVSAGLRLEGDHLRIAKLRGAEEWFERTGTAAGRDDED